MNKINKQVLKIPNYEINKWYFYCNAFVKNDNQDLYGAWLYITEIEDNLIRTENTIDNTYYFSIDGKLFKSETYRSLFDESELPIIFKKYYKNWLSFKPVQIKGHIEDIKKLYFKVYQDKSNLEDYYVTKFEDVKELCDYNKSEIVEHNEILPLLLEPVYLTEKEYNELPEFTGY